MRVIIFLTLVLLSSATKAQDFDKYSTDTIKLGDFKSKKIVAYKIKYITFYFSLKECKKDFLTYWRRYREGIRQIQEQKKNGTYKDTEVNRRISAMDSVYRILTNHENSNTVYVNQQLFDWGGLRGFDIDKQIEKGQCAISDSNNIRHYLIIRKKGSWYKGPLAAWGGRRYFLPGYDTYFIEATDWIS
jgi:hypothetical protein